MNIDVGQIYRDLVAGRDAGATGYGLLQWAAKQEFIEQVLQNPLLQASRDKLLPFRLFKLYDTVGDRILFESRYMTRRKTLLVSALCVWLWNDPDDISTLEDCIWALCDDYTWSLPAHMHGASLSLVADAISFNVQADHNPTESATTVDLFACETGLALTEICALLGDKLHPFIVDRARSEVMRRVVDSYMQKAVIQPWE
jgi:hypothetical protein